MFVEVTLLCRKIEQPNLCSQIVEATAKAREEGLKLRLGGQLMLRRRRKGDGQRAGKMKKKNQNALSCQPGQPEREKRPLHLR
jgi:hypothetical protein